jgi:hypothetical protein
MRLVSVAALAAFATLTAGTATAEEDPWIAPAFGMSLEAVTRSTGVPVDPEFSAYFTVFGTEKNLEIQPYVGVGFATDFGAREGSAGRGYFAPYLRIGAQLADNYIRLGTKLQWRDYLDEERQYGLVLLEGAAALPLFTDYVRLVPTLTVGPSHGEGEPGLACGAGLSLEFGFTLWPYHP